MEMCGAIAKENGACSVTSMHSLHRRIGCVSTLLRFHSNDAGAVQKSNVTIGFQAGEIARVPYFADNTHLEWIPYGMGSGVMHLGQSNQSGHYRSFLTEVQFPLL